MKRVVVFLLLIVSTFYAGGQSWIRVNQSGYLPSDIKVAVLISTQEANASFQVYDAITEEVVLSGEGSAADGEKWGMKSAFRLDFSKINTSGGYYLMSNGVKSPVFRVSSDVYDGLTDFLLVYMRQQRCGDNPYTDTLCHQHDGFIVDHPTRSGEKIDVTGGWHDATDYLQYVTTSATAAYHLLFAYMEQKDKSVFGDRYNERGRPGANGIPDILDEARWGLEWLMKMNPEPGVMFNQVADDRDHAGFRRPQYDKVDYGWGPGEGRPAYFVTGKPQGLGKWINRTTGVSSTAGKFSSSFALGYEVFKDIDPAFAIEMRKKAEDAFMFALEDPGNTQTACLASPYFYEEDSFVDDIELAAATFYGYTGDNNWRRHADYWGELEPISPWMELGRGRHYQWYPFINLGHYYLAKSNDPALSSKYKEFMKQGLQCLKERAAGDPFVNGIPYIWCSNNLTSAAITQARLYHEVTGDGSFLEMETALRDWLLGCNPWGTSMIVGYPVGSDYPDSPHSSYTVYNGDLTYGGLVDGPVYNDVFSTRAGKSLTKEDSYAIFNNGIAVYHDDIGDYASNEPTMDGTAGLAYYFSKMESKGNSYADVNVEKDRYGAVIRINSDKKVIYLTFTADSLFNGADHILKVLKKQGVKGSFFLTGNCLRMDEHKNMIERIIKEGHYVGGHSDKHLLYAPWGKRDSLYFTPDQIREDARLNIIELGKFGVEPSDAAWFIPPYEYYNKEVVSALNSIGLRVMNYTPGTNTPADYTEPSMPNYKNSQNIINTLYGFESIEGLNGAIILIHPGVSDKRPDKLYLRLTEIIRDLKKKGYSFESLKDFENK